MRLIHAEDFVFKDFIGKNVPEYAIISHRWCDDEEVSYQDFVQRRDEFLQGGCGGYGWTKIAKAAKLTLFWSLKWFWIDTCCIDKKSSAELSEAINSMFKWYQNSVVCFAFLIDVHPLSIGQSQTSNDPSSVWATKDNDEAFDASQLKASTWFTRAWTLQELLAPSDVRFFNSAFYQIGSRNDLASFVGETTGIDLRFLRTNSQRNRRHFFSGACVAERMRVSESMSEWVNLYPRLRVANYKTYADPSTQLFQWASNRDATREEDIAYCLLGIFQVNMPLLYGEGKRAFSRLQSEIVKSTSDTSIFAWRYNPNDELAGLLAPDISCFSHERPIRSRATRNLMQHPYEETNLGIRWPLWLSEVQMSASFRKGSAADVIIPLNCSLGQNAPNAPQITAAIKVTLVGYREKSFAGDRNDSQPFSGILLGRRTSSELLRLEENAPITLPFVQPEGPVGIRIPLDGSERNFSVCFPSDWDLGPGE